jgi:DNA mismatch endonuclease (patch repair protein)
MSAVGRVGTKPELALRSALRAEGLRGYRVDVRSLPGRPDILFSRAQLAVFVDGAFWHGHPSKFHRGIAGAYWDAKIGGNQLRDGRANQALRKLGWSVVRVWDFEVAEDAVAVARRGGRVYRARLDQPSRKLVRNRVG